MNVEKGESIMKNYNDITIMSLGFFLSDQGVLEWFLSELMGRQIKLARPPETAMPWEEVALTPDIQAASAGGYLSALHWPLRH